MEDLLVVETGQIGVDRLRKQVQRGQVLDDVGLAVRDQDNVVVVEGPVHVSDVLVLDERVVRRDLGHQVLEVGQQLQDSVLGQILELSR